MEESRVVDDWFTSSSRTLVLVGRPGNGKSATGNSILGKKESVSKTSFAGVTRTSELRSTVLNDGQTLKVIDTPGFFDSSIDIEFVKREIVKCMNLERDGIHAILLVLSVRYRISKDEEAAIRGMRILFGSRVYDYMIVLYTGGDELEESGQTLEEYLEGCPDSLKETISLCGHRYMLFDNKTNDQQKRTQQLHDLLSLVNELLTKSNGKPHTDESLRDLKVASRLKETTAKLEQLAEEHSRLKEATRRLEQQLEQGARLKAEEMAHAVQTKTNNEIRKLREHLERAQRETEELRNRAKSGKCAIL